MENEETTYKKSPKKNEETIVNNNNCCEETVINSSCKSDETIVNHSPKNNASVTNNTTNSEETVINTSQHSEKKYSVSKDDSVNSIYQSGWADKKKGANNKKRIIAGASAAATAAAAAGAGFFFMNNDGNESEAEEVVAEVEAEYAASNTNQTEYQSQSHTSQVHNTTHSPEPEAIPNQPPIPEVVPDDGPVPITEQNSELEQELEIIPEQVEIDNDFEIHGVEVVHTGNADMTLGDVTVNGEDYVLVDIDGGDFDMAMHFVNNEDGSQGTEWIDIRDEHISVDDIVMTSNDDSEEYNAPYDDYIVQNYTDSSDASEMDYYDDFN